MHIIASRQSVCRVNDATYFSLEKLYQPWKDTTLEKKTQNRDRFEYFEWSKKIEPQRFCQVLPATICPSNVLPSDPSDSKPSESNTRTGRPFGPEEK